MESNSKTYKIVADIKKGEFLVERFMGKTRYAHMVRPLNELADMTRRLREEGAIGTIQF